ncbi:MAG: NADH-quinone oxidoreductase subunit J [Cyanobacteria bacterium NC_groundwater_1444_Ag_S-0.65um_54_12]|nr:NADH-quinone oxidoreductase subunit J [Cyanobacteria bacterium NC_groundwater_1444_Ag_S-0.65um_54_12]
MGNQLVFYLVAAIILVAASGVIFLKNTVHSTFMLVLAFLGVAVVYLMLNADFLAMAQVLIYAGAIVIMLLFALMLTQRRETIMLGGPDEGRSFVGGLVALLLFVIYFRIIASSPWANQNLTQSTLAAVVKDPQTQAIIGTAPIIGKEFFGTFLLPFEVASIILLMALIGAILLAKRDSKKS